MQSSGSTSFPPSHDSLCSSDSFLLSDSEHAEDDTDVFLSESESTEGLSKAGQCSRWLPNKSENPDVGEGWRSQEGCSPEVLTRPTLVTSLIGKETDMEKKGQTKGDLLFAQKCAELQGFVRPLLELLNGLKKGRFDRGLSSFQQSVAMDRIQRIVGVLQKPTNGEKYLHTLLQVEMMLKLWFPQISTRTQSSHNPLLATPPHKHKDQLHIPVKKRKLSWSDSDNTDQTNPSKISQRGWEERQAGMNKGATTSHTSRTGSSGESDGESSGYRTPRHSEPSLTWVHVAPILSPAKSCSTHSGGQGGSPLATQDNSVSSTTPSSDSSRPSIQPCRLLNSVAIVTEPSGGGASETCQGRSQLSCL